ERQQATRARACQSWQCSCAPRDDPARLDSSSASEGQRASPVVSGTHRRRPRQNAQDHDYSVGSKTSDRALAAGDDRRSTGQLQTLQTPEGTAVPANTLAELRRDMDHLRFVKQQIKQIEAARVKRLESEPGERRHAMVYLLARVVGIGVESA